jgi:predicted enzyme related to lactoylglutathione lyase
MDFAMPQVPRGSGEHPIALVVVTANSLAASSTFYSKVFGWQVQPMSAELAGVIAPGGPTAALRANVPAGFPGMVPYIGARDVDAMLARVVAAGGTIERAAVKLPGIGKLARFKEPTGTIYGLTDALPPGGLAHVPMPFDPNPKPPAGAICSIEMHAGDEVAAPRFFGELFGWGTLATMPQYVAFDPGAGVGGVFQTHTPALSAVAYIYATDVEAKLAEIEAAGGKRMGEAMRMPGVACFGYFQDPSGTSMGLIGP